MSRLAAIAALCALAAGCHLTSLQGLEFECDAGDQCAPSFRCWKGTCTQDAGYGPGTMCSGDEDCASRACIAGICCDRACAGACESCLQSATVGQCLPVPLGTPSPAACGLYLCDGVSGGCQQSCADDLLCAQGHFCEQGVCVPSQDIGSSCPRDQACDSGFCQDGFCCDTACGSACDFCNLPALEGHCTVATPGHPSSGTCTYACTGSASCPTSCTSDAGCNPSFNCGIYRTCQPKLSTLSDDFEDGVVDAGQWSVDCVSGLSTEEVNGLAEFDISPGAFGWCQYYSAQSYDPANASATIFMSRSGKADQFDKGYLFLNGAGLNRIGFNLQNGYLNAEERDGGYTRFWASVSYNSTVHRYLRIELDAGTVFWRVSKDNSTFSTLYSVPAPAWMQSVWVEFGANIGFYEDAGHSYFFDDFNR